LRPGELRALQWRDVDFENATLTVQRTISRDTAGHVTPGDTTKTGKIRAIALTPSTLDALLAWRSVQKVRSLDDWIFTTPRGAYLPLTSLQRLHADVIRRAGVPAIRLHDLRHTAATLLLEQNVHPKIVSDILGHASIQTTIDVYSHTSVDLQRDTLNRLDDVLFRGKNG